MLYIFYQERMSSLDAMELYYHKESCCNALIVLFLVISVPLGLGARHRRFPASRGLFSVVFAKLTGASSMASPDG